MKMLASLLLMLCLYNVSTAQDDAEKPTLSKAEEFSSQSGTLIHIEFVEVGTVRLIKFRVLKIKDLITGKNTTALRMDYPYANDDQVTTLDSDEMDGFIKTIKAFQNDIFNTKPKNYTEITFRSRTGFEAGAYFSVDKEKWVGYFKIEDFIRSPTIFLTREHYAEVLEVLEKAKKMM